jgi:crotonobetainyl-CoA:carnitine CoA-transferase CaiB-like acyl-CoA transferase
MSGFVNLCGEAGGPPQHTNYPVGDAVAGLWGAFAISTALAERNALPRAQQRGCEIDLSATEALMRLLDPLAAEYQLTGVARHRTGSRASYTAPSNVYRSADDVWITLVGSSDPIFKRLCLAMEQPGLAVDARFASNVARTRHHVTLDDHVAAWCASLPFNALAAALDRHEVPYSKVYSIADALDDPHFRERGAFMQIHDEALGAITVPSPVPRFVGRDTPVAPCAGPATGQHNAEVYGALGLGQEELARLREDGVI